MSNGLFSREAGKEVGSRPLGATLRPVGRIALWAVLAILLIRGGAALLESPERSPAGVDAARPEGPGQPAEALAVGFARAYLEAPSPSDLRGYLAEGAHIGAGHRPGVGGGVAQAEVVKSTRIGAGRWVLTVSCDLRDARTLDLVVPIVRQEAGEAAALGAPSIVAVPAPAGVDPERPRPIAGSGSGAIGELISKFMPAYVSAGKTSELSYLLAPGATVVPLGGALKMASVGHPRQLGGGEAAERELTVGVSLRYPASGAVYPLTYRLRVVERARRWYVAAVEGAVA
ncbi:MAG: conjugal transfer protein [Actinobacteria bacterium]|nr:conjugal transfer protein [Actinomycetota bacterium]